MVKLDPMRAVAAVLLLGGTVCAMFGGARLPEAEWTLAGIGVAVLVAGTVLWRVAERKGLAAGRAQVSAAAVREDLARVRDVTAELLEAALPSDELLERLSALEREELARLSEAFPTVAGSLGAKWFAELLSGFSAGERQLRRAWSAAADGDGYEAVDALERARADLDHTLSELDEAMQHTLEPGSQLAPPPTMPETGRR